MLPWVNLESSFMRLTTYDQPRATEGLPRDKSWYADARLVVVEWTVTGAYRTNAKVTVP